MDGMHPDERPQGPDRRHQPLIGDHRSGFQPHVGCCRRAVFEALVDIRGFQR